MKPMRGRKFGSSAAQRTATRLDDNLFATDTVEIILAVSEGPCVGLVDGASGFRVGDVPLVDPGSETPNISNFELRIHKGTRPADTILPNLGGIGSSVNVGLDMRSEGQQVVASGKQIQIDYIDLRFAFGRLFVTNDRGDEGNATLTLKIEVKPRSAASWGTPISNEPPDTKIETAGASNYRPGAQRPGSYRNASFHETYIQDSMPLGSQLNAGAMWFHTGEQYWRPHILDNNEIWTDPQGLTYETVGIFIKWTWIDLTGSTRAAWYDTTGQQRSPDAGSISPNDFLLIPSAGQEVYNWNGVSWNDPTEQFTTPTPAAAGEFVTTGITRSTYPREVRIPVARINEPYDVRVTRVSAKENKQYFAQVTWESIQEVKRELYSFPGLALAHLTIKATDTFSSIPEFTQVWDGRIIRVPTNYDPVARTYSGFWDGTFKLAYSNNPGWVAYDLVMNSEYGKNAYYPEVMDPLAIYEFAKHCDAHGFTMNEYIQDPRSLNETINYIVGTAGGRYVDRGDGYSTILFDADDQPSVALFTQENVIDGLFTYSFTDITSRKNDYKVSFINPLIGWKEDRLRVYDQNSIDVQGSNPEEFIAVGCTDGEEAVKRGRLRLATALTEKTIVSFKTNRQGLYVQPFQIILVGDPNAEEVITGRVKSVTGNTRIDLRDEVYIEAGIELLLSVFVGDGKGGFQARQYRLANGPGRTTVLNLADPLDVVLPEKAVFSIGTPKAFRITTIEETEDPDNVSITAIEINRLKWAFVDGKVQLSDLIGLQSGPLSRFTFAVTNLQAVGITRADGSVSVILTWTPSPSMTGGYRVYSSYEGKQSEVVGEPGAPLFEIPNVLSGYYVFTVVALSVDKSTESPPAAISFTISGGFRPVANVLNLRLVDEPESPIFRKRDPKFAWDASTDDLLDHYIFEILGESSQVVFSKELTKETLEFVFSLEMNKAAGGPRRSFTVRLRAVDADGNISQPALLAVTHPPPLTPNPKLSHTPESLFVIYERPAGDVLGVLVWVTQTAGFDPAKTTPVYDGDMTQVIIPVKSNETYFVRIALYDSYGKTGLTYSAEIAYKVAFGFDTTDPGIPTGLALSSETVKNADGTLITKITGKWNASTQNNLSRYDFELREISRAGVAGDWIRWPVTTTTYTVPGARAGFTYDGRVRSVSRNDYQSGYSPIVQIVAGANMEPPGPATRLTATAAFITVSLGWTNPTDPDLDYVEVWESPTAALSDAKLVGKPDSNFFVTTMPTSGLTRYYWVRPVNNSKVPAASFTGPVQAISAQVVKEQLENEAIDMTKFAKGLTPIAVVDVLPDPTTWTGPDYLTLTTDGLLYNRVNGKWVTGVDAVNIRGQVKDAQIAALAAAKVTGQLTDAQIAALAAAKVTGQIVETQIGPGAITTPKIATGAIIAGTIAASAVTADAVAANAITTAKIDAGAVVAAKIAAGAIETDKLAAGSVVAGKLAANAVSADTIQANAITSAKISAGAVRTQQLDASAVTTDKLAAGAVVADKVAANAIYATHIAAGQVTADAIASNAITANKIAANAITSTHIAAKAIQADRIQLGSSGAGLNSWLDGGNNAFLNGGYISANSIGVNRLVAGARGLTISGISFSADKANRVLSWTSGQIAWINDAGNVQEVSISANSVPSGGQYVQVYWVQGSSGFNAERSSQYVAAVTAGNAVLMATYDGFAGINATYGATILDGSRINAGTITANQIAANSIVASNIAAGTITATEIGAGQITGAKIGGGTITASEAINIGSDRFQITAAQRRMRIFSNNGVENVTLGDISPWVSGSENASNFGIIIRTADNNEVMRVFNGGATIEAAYIKNLQVDNAQIKNAAITNLKLGDGAVNNPKMENSAVTQAVTSYGGGSVSGDAYIYNRGTGKILVMGFFNGSSNGPAVSPGQEGRFVIRRNGGDIANVAASFSIYRTDNGNVLYLNSMAIAATDAPGAGVYYYTAYHSNAQGIGGVLVVVMELSK